MSKEDLQLSRSAYLEMMEISGTTPGERKKVITRKWRFEVPEEGRDERREPKISTGVVTRPFRSLGKERTGYP